MKKSILVIKLGGSLMQEDSVKEQFFNDLLSVTSLDVSPVLVHGGGKDISAWMEACGETPEFIGGYRKTNTRAMDITEMVLSGHINKDLTAQLTKKGVLSVGISGKDAGLLMGKIKDQALGLVGEVSSVNCKLINDLLALGYLPVISPVASDLEGNTLNLNADHAAQEIAIALKADHLIVMTDVDGLLVEGKLQSKLTLNQAKNYLTHPDVKGGMIPKLLGAIHSVENGVGQVRIVNGKQGNICSQILSQSTSVGTTITA